MKKILILIFTVLLLTGCVNVNKSSFEDIQNEILSSKTKIYNTYRKGYKFYLPSTMYLDSYKEYNEVIKSSTETYYLYIDLISYLHNVTPDYIENRESYYSKTLITSNNKGYVEINQKNDKYLVEIMYNYAKIEVIVEEANLKKAVSNALIVLSSIYYNDNVLKSLSDETLLTYKEEVVDIFANSLGNENSNFIKYVEDDYTSDDDFTLPDYDLIN